MGTSAGAVKRWSNAGVINTIPQLTDREWLAARYHQDGLTQKQIGELLGVTQQNVQKAMRLAGVPTRTKSAAVKLRYGYGDVDIEWLWREYSKGRSQGDIAGEIGCAAHMVGYWLRQAGYQLRTPAEACRLSWKTNTERREKLRRAVAHRRRPTGARRVDAEFRRQVKEGRKACAICGKGEGLEIHHLNGDRGDSRQENLIALCHFHHGMIEWFIRPVVERWMRPEEGDYDNS